MTQLRDLQEQFQSYVHQKAQGIESKIVDAPQISIEQRIDIYREGYYLRLTEILEREFSALRNHLGKEAFEALCRDYIDAYPSTHFSVKTYGRYMSQFLSNRPNTDPLHLELAEFEWAFGKVIEGPDGPQLNFNDMGAIPAEAWAHLRLELHPSLRFVTLSLNTPAIWRALFENDPEKHPVPAVEKTEHPVQWMVWRFNQRAHYNEATAAHLLMIEAIKANQNFPQICEALCEIMDVDQVPQFAGTTLREWVNLGLISRFNISP